MFNSSPTQHGPCPNDYSSPYYLTDPCPLFYGHSPPSPSLPPTSLPDLYYEYGLDASPSSSSSEISSTPPLLPSTWDFTEPAYSFTPTYHPNTPMGLSTTEMTCYESPAMGEASGVRMTLTQYRAKGHEILPHTMTHPQSSSLTTAFVSPADTLLGPCAPISTPPSQSSPKLHQPRPSRRIPIVDLNELASACDTFHPNSQGNDRIECDSLYPPYQWLKQPYPISEPVVKQGSSVTSEERILLCSCGCMESYRLQ